MIVLSGVQLVDPTGAARAAHDIVISDGRIAWIGPTGSHSGESAQLIDCTGKLAIPGLINAHTHSHAVAMRGLADRWCLEVSLAYAPWAIEAQSDDLIYWTAYAGAAEMALAGTTACYDLVLTRPPISARTFALVAQAYADVGMRAVLAPMVSDVSLYSALPGVLQRMPPTMRARAERYQPPSAHVTLSACAEIFETWSFDRSRIKPAIAPTILNHCTPEFLEGCLELHRTHDLPVHMHVAESALQRDAGQVLFGRSLVAELARRKVLGPWFCAAHCVWIDDDDRARLADSGSAMAHIPVSNLRLGAGVAHPRDAHAAGVVVGFASDGANSADSLSMFEVMKQATLVSRIGHRDARERWLGAGEALSMCTEGGARIVQFPHVGGRIAVGAAADLTLLDLDGFAFTPLNNPVTQLVTAASARDVCDVMVDGAFIVRDRTLVHGDLAHALARLRAAVAACFDPNSQAKADADALLPFVLEGYRSPIGRSGSGREGAEPLK